MPLSDRQDQTLQVNAKSNWNEVRLYGMGTV